MADAEGQDINEHVAVAIDKAGWEQFCFVRQGDEKNLLEPQQELPDGARLLVISNSCDLVHDGPDFPRAEVLEVRTVPVSDPQLLKIGSPRAIQFGTSVAPNSAIVVWEAQVSRRHYFQRKHLATLLPDKTISMRTPQDGPSGRPLSADRLARWLGRQYDRPVLPSEFNRRRFPNRGKIRDCVRKLVKLGAEELYFRLDPEGEVDPKEVYDLQVLAVFAPGADTAAAAKPLDLLAQRMEECGGIHVGRKAVLTADQVHISDIRGMISFDVFEELSPF